MKKVYDHSVFYNGVLYPANTPIEVKEEKTVTEEKTETAETPKKPAKKGGAKNDDKGTV